MTSNNAPHHRPNEEYEILAPINVSRLALLSGYLGLASVLILPAPLSIVFGLLALHDLRGRPEKTGQGRAWFAIVTGVVGTAVLLFAFVSGIARRHH